MRILLAAVCSFAVVLTGFTLPERPTAHINDYAHVLNSTEAQHLEGKLSVFENVTGNQAAVAIFPSIGDQPVEEVAVALFEKWKLGQAGKDNGVLLVLAVQEHRGRIEVGYGLEDKLPDALAGRILRDEMVPHLAQGGYGAAVAIFAQRLDDIFVQGKQPVYRRQNRRLGPNEIIFALFFLMFLTSLARRSRRGRTLGSRGIYGGFGGWGGGFGGGFGGWGGGGGGGWGGGGGGRSGGGGASGGW
jgi:uncharacterized protein